MNDNTLKVFQVDAFADKIFEGNPASVCPLPSWKDDQTLQQIALENNQAETAFYVAREEHYEIRWFTPTTEVDLCGHATLAAAFVLFFHEGHTESSITFYSPRSGELTVTKNEGLLTLNFPSDSFAEIPITDELVACFNFAPLQAFKGKTDLMFVYETEEHIRKAIPDLTAIFKLPCRGVIITAGGQDVDFVSRFFAPQSGIDEDPVTGSAHTTLTPYWATRLDKTLLSAMQLSKRTGRLQCKFLGARVEISGQCQMYMKGEICFL